MTTLFADTETTGFPKREGSYVRPDQARICQIGLILAPDGAGPPIAEFCSTVVPNGWTIGQKAQECHGLSDVHCAKFGLKIETVFGIFCAMLERADRVVCYNRSFDQIMIEIEGAYVGKGMPKKPWDCAMEMAVDKCKMPPTESMIKNGRADQFKTPSLEEALSILCGKQLGKFAHNALYDARALREVWETMNAPTISPSLLSGAAVQVPTDTAPTGGT